MKGILKHDEYVETLCGEVGECYQVLYRGLPLISSRGRLVGEIDLVGVNKYHVDVYEVKCSFRLSKAKRQLEKIRKLFGSGEVNFYFYCGEGKQLVKLSA